ncbi:SQT1_1 [Sanghuangporus vaninii]
MVDAARTEDLENEEEVDEEYLNEDDVLAELADDGDAPMDEDEDEGQVEGEDSVVYEDNSVRHFSAHGKSVFAMSMHPIQPIAASGGEDDFGYLWNVQSGETIVKLTGHTDSVTSTGFSSDG